LDFAIDMLRKLVREPDVYECACLLVVEGAQGMVETAADEEEERGPDEEPAALVPLPPEAVDDDGEDTGTESPPTDAKDTVSRVRLLSDDVPADLAPGSFFEILIGAALDRMPVAVYSEVRRRVELAHGDA
jgi:hypothetical protein